MAMSMTMNKMILLDEVGIVKFRLLSKSQLLFARDHTFDAIHEIFGNIVTINSATVHTAQCYLRI